MEARRFLNVRRMLHRRFSPRLTFSVAPTTFLPLSLLSLPSLLSSVSTLLLLFIVVADGLWKTTAPGSIRDPQVTSWSPDFHGGNVLGGLGLMLAGFGGHSVMPSLARDMKHPLHFDKVWHSVCGTSD